MYSGDHPRWGCHRYCCIADARPCLSEAYTTLYTEGDLLCKLLSEHCCGQVCIGSVAGKFMAVVHFMHTVCISLSTCVHSITKTWIEVQVCRYR